jgi:hypothetical protein
VLLDLVAKPNAVSWIALVTPMPTLSWVIVYTGGMADTALLRDLLVAAGIEAQLGDEVMGTMAPYVVSGGTGTMAAIKVVVPEERLEDARPIVAEFASPEGKGAAPGAPPIQPWECPCCHEQNDGTFDICWNCQSERTEGRR